MTHDHAAQLPDEQKDIFSIPRPDWIPWSTTRTTSLWKAVALLCDIDPSHLAYTFDHDCLSPSVLKKHPANFIGLLQLAKSNLGPHSLQPISVNPNQLENSEVGLTAFAAWAAQTGIPLPAGFPWRPGRSNGPLGQPWEQHDTKLLRILAAAADRFWKNYDPKDRTSAPTNEQVVTWLEAQGVTTRIANAMATILRADDLPSGRR